MREADLEKKFLFASEVLGLSCSTAKNLETFVLLAALNRWHNKGAGGAGGAPELKAEPIAGDGSQARRWMALSGRPVGVGQQGGHGEAPAAEGKAGSGQEAWDVVAVTHQKHPAEGRHGSRRVSEPGGEGGELAGGILAAAVDEERPGAGAKALGGGGLAGEGAAEQKQGTAGALKGGIEAVVAVEHHHQGGARGGSEGRADQGPEQPEGGGGDREGAGGGVAAGDGQCVGEETNRSDVPA